MQALDGGRTYVAVVAGTVVTGCAAVECRRVGGSHGDDRGGGEEDGWRMHSEYLGLLSCLLCFGISLWVFPFHGGRVMAMAMY